MKKIKSIISILLIVIALLTGKSLLAHDKLSNHTYSKDSSANENSPKYSPSEENKIKNACNEVKITSNKQYTLEGAISIEGIDATFIRDVDGDTVLVKYNDKEHKIRFLMTDTPETVKKNTPVEPFGVQAKEFVKEKLHKGQSIKIVAGRDKTDKYGRELGYIFYNQNGKWFNLNEDLVSQGLARIAYVYDKKDKLLPTMYKAEESARKQQINIWSIPGYVTNRGFDLNSL